MMDAGWSIIHQSEKMQCLGNWRMNVSSTSQPPLCNSSSSIKIPIGKYVFPAEGIAPVAIVALHPSRFMLKSLRIGWEWSTFISYLFLTLLINSNKLPSLGFVHSSMLSTSLTSTLKSLWNYFIIISILITIWLNNALIKYYIY